MMTESEKARIGAWQKDNIAAVNLHVRKGVRDTWRGYADQLGLTMVDFIRAAVEEKAERDGLMDEAREAGR